MPFVDTLKRVAATLFAILHNRAELLAVEVEEEVLRFFSWMLLSALALICFGAAAMLLILLVVVAFWDSYRLTAIAGMMVLFGLAAVGMALYVRNAYRTKPRFLAATLDELAKDAEMLKPSGKQVRQ